MKIHEYQAKELFRSYNIPVPNGYSAQTPEEAGKLARKLAPGKLAVKAQIHAGGRGKGGGVKIVDSPDEAEKFADQILGTMLITPQTGPEGSEVRTILLEEGSQIKTEFYLGLTLNRATARPVIMASPAGGMNIEDVAEKTPELIFKESVDPRFGIQPFQGRVLARKLGFTGKNLRTFSNIVINLYRLFSELDASLVEINPLALTEDGGLIALDAKIDFDNSALFRHPELKELDDPFEKDPAELEAGKYNLNYIKLDGNIGAMVNGAGLAMATMDLIKNAGAEPANFLDVGGGADAEMISNGFRIILADKNVKALLINIFGGILRCDVLAQGVVDAAKEVKVEVPIIVRLEGTNSEEGQRILKDSGLTFSVAKNLNDAALKVADLAGDI